ncbi:hypothetical protein BDY24DRAFT_419504 [Mrakia frigida]|uniref:uncharacterized protein n=1 Tax=Mrakia frigida TaxID=29902 RepID=UPI003FCBFD8F
MKLSLGIPLVSPSYLSAPTVVLEPWGSLSMTAPPDSYYPPRPRQGWCTVTLFPRDVHVRNFLIPTGLEDDQVRFSLNVTWGLPSYNGDDKSTNCSNPAQLYKAFFLSHLLQISPVPPVSSPVPLFPGTPPSPSLTTTFAALSTLAPPNVPAKVDHTHDGEKRNFAALGAVLGLGVVAAVLVVYWAARRKRRWIAAGGEDPDY